MEENSMPLHSTLTIDDESGTLKIFELINSVFKDKSKSRNFRKIKAFFYFKNNSSKKNR